MPSILPVTQTRLGLVHILAIGTALLATTGASPADPNRTDTYTNPIIDRLGPADPHVFEHEGTYYMSFTDDSTSYRMYTSSDLIHWNEGPVVYEPGEPHVWAPDFYYHPDDEMFYLYYTVNFTVGVARSDAPDEPFEKVHDLVENSIDAHLFRDDDGNLYLYYATLADTFELWVQPMADPVTPEGEPTLLFVPTQEWERHNVVEGPWMLKHEGTYYLTYSGGGADQPYYAIGYATADDPAGPFEKHKANPIVHRREGLYGPGHHSVVRDGAGELWMVYHQKNEPGVAYDRFICIDPLRFDEQGRLHGRATRGEPQPAPTPLTD